MRRDRRGRRRRSLVGWRRRAAVHTAGAADAYGNVEATEVVVGAEAGGQLVVVRRRGRTDAGGRRGGRHGRRDASSALAARSADGAARRQRVARERGRPHRSTCSQAQRAAARGAARRGPAQRAALESAARDRPPHLRAHPAAVRAAGGHRAAARSGRARRPRARGADQGAGRADRGAGQPGRGADRSRSPRPARSGRPPRRRFVDRRAGRAGRRAHPQEPDHQSVAGTVLVTYAKAGEIVQPGQPLYKIADLRRWTCAPTSTEPQLAQVQAWPAGAGHGRRRRADRADADRHGHLDLVRRPSSRRRRSRRATSAPISSTRSRSACRTTDGLLKIGMPVDVQFARECAR